MSTKIELEHLGKAELGKLIKQAMARKSLVEQRAPKAAVRRQMLAYAKKEGYSIQELFGSSEVAQAPVVVSGRAPPRLKGVKLPVMYRHPDDKRLTWTGRGRQPRWLAELIGDGHELKQFKLKQVYKPR